MAKLHRSHWVHPEKQRYYQADLVKDLFGEWTLIWAWGSMETSRGKHRITGIASHEEGLRRVTAMDIRRRKRGYVPVETR